MLLEKTDSYLVYVLKNDWTIVSARDGLTMIAIKATPHVEPDIRVYTTVFGPCDGYIQCVHLSAALELFTKESGIEYHGSHLIPF